MPTWNRFARPSESSSLACWADVMSKVPAPSIPCFAHVHGDRRGDAVTVHSRGARLDFFARFVAHVRRRDWCSIGLALGDSVGVRSESVCIGVLCAMPPGECGGEYAARRRGGGRDARSGTNVSTAGSTKRNGNHRISAMNGFVFKSRRSSEVLSRRDERGTVGPPTSADRRPIDLAESRRTRTTNHERPGPAGRARTGRSFPRA